MGLHLTPNQESKQGLLELTQEESTCDGSNKDSLKDSKADKSMFEDEANPETNKQKKKEIQIFRVNILLFTFSGKKKKETEGEDGK